MITETEAKKKLCPLSYSQPGGALNCIGSDCMLWVRATGPAPGPVVRDVRQPAPPYDAMGCCGLTGAGR